MSNIQDLEMLVNDGKLPEHPTYEDMLYAIALQKSMEETKSVFKDLIEAF